MTHQKRPSPPSSSVKKAAFHKKKLQHKDVPNKNIDKHIAETTRINKALADAGFCSRRKAEEWITQGKVFVDGQKITDLAFKVAPHESIVVDGKEILRHVKRSYVMLHKPVQTMCTAHDPEGRETIFDILPDKWRQKRLFTVGRLDYFSEGLLILTDDGQLAQKLSHPSHHLNKVYRVLVREEVTPQMLETMQKGMTLAEGERLAPVQVHIVRPPNANTSTTLLEMILHQGINRQIRRMCRDLGLTIFKLIRVAQGSILLGDLKPGEVRELTSQEIDSLLKQ